MEIPRRCSGADTITEEAMVRKLLIGVVVVVVILAAVGLLLPGQVHVERSVVINAAPAAVFPHVSDLRAFNQWSPWAQRDPNTQYTFSGPPAGVGAKMAWKSENPNVGEGSQEITAVEPDKHVSVALDFGAMGSATASYDLQAEGAGTQVVWAFDETLGLNPIARYFGLMMDGWIGPDYEAGLANLKSLVETSTPSAPAAPAAPATP
jgi:uncharacterized protein YndB with AHSA1/START domain